ncbi:MAG: hypothetical protein ACRD96_20775 [Bryobacteraceae bacterium]
MVNFREFDAGPDPFGRNWRVQFKWLLSGIATRHSDSIDVKFVLETEGERQEKMVALGHPDLLRLSAAAGRALTDPWCSRLAALHLKRMIETGEDMDKDLVTTTGDQLAAYNGEL